MNSPDVFHVGDWYKTAGATQSSAKRPRFVCVGGTYDTNALFAAQVPQTLSALVETLHNSTYSTSWRLCLRHPPNRSCRTSQGRDRHRDGYPAAQLSPTPIAHHGVCANVDIQPEYGAYSIIIANETNFVYFSVFLIKYMCFHFYFCLFV